jgi:hypothetical protein
LFLEIAQDRVACRLNNRRRLNGFAASGSRGSEFAERQEIHYMRRRKDVAMTAGLLVLIMWTLAAAVSPDRSPASTPLAVAQPVILPAALRPAPVIGDSGMLLLVGSGLIALAALVRKTPPV